MPRCGSWLPSRRRSRPSRTRRRWAPSGPTVIRVSPGLRMLRVRGFGKYLLFYRETPEGIELVRVLHAARDIGAALGEED